MSAIRVASATSSATPLAFVRSLSSSSSSSSSLKPTITKIDNNNKNDHHRHHHYIPKLAVTKQTDQNNDATITISQQQLQEQKQEQKCNKHLVLVGGGHAHVQVIKALNKSSRPSWLKVTLVDMSSSASYSGMVPGCIANFYQPKETLLQLEPLASWASIPFLQKEVIDINIDQKLIYLRDANANTNNAITTLSFDCISLDIGSISRGYNNTKGATEYTIPTRPISKLVQRIDQAEQSMLLEEKKEKETSKKETTKAEPHLVVIGGGAAGIELSLSMAGRWKEHKTRVTLINAASSLVSGESNYCQQALAKVLKDRNIETIHNSYVNEITQKYVHLSDKQSSTTTNLAYTHCIWATGAESHLLSHKLQEKGLQCTNNGWFEVNEYLQSISHPYIFAAGDCCSMTTTTTSGTKNILPVPKAGVYAVRSGPILIDNLTNYLQEQRQQEQRQEQEPGEKSQQKQKESSSSSLPLSSSSSSLLEPKKDNGALLYPLIKYKPQNDFLKLIICGDGNALGFRFGLPIYGKWVRELKDCIDQSFMNLFKEEYLPVLATDNNNNNYDNSQYDAQFAAQEKTENQLLLLSNPKEAAKLLLSSATNINYKDPWLVLRTMAENDTYQKHVIEYAKEILEKQEQK